MRCVTGQLRTYLNLGAQDNMQYNTLREQCLRWDRAQQRWSGLVAGDEQVIPMDVDRVKGKGKCNNSYGSYGGQSKGYGSKGKGKGDKGYQKGKSDGKGKSKDAKGKSKKGNEKGKGKADNDRFKGKGKSDKQCHTCGKFGHFSRDCWQNQQVRAVSQNPGAQSMDAGSVQQSGPQGSPTSSATGSFTQVSSVSQQAPHGQQQAQSTQYRVARIVEDTAGDLVFDLTSNAFHGGSVRALYYNIGDHDDDGCFDLKRFQMKMV